MRFEKFQLSEDLLRNLDRIGFHRTTDIQYKAIPSILNGEDVLAIAQTGTGKTAAFAIPVIQLLHEQKSSKRALGIKCLVMVPTRELSEQIGEVFNELAKHTKVKALAVFGGVEKDHQIQRIQDGLDILIATPGRMFDLIRNNFISLDKVEILVLDESDKMLDLGFINDVQAVKRKLTRRHQTLFFSATINPKIKKMAYSQVRSNAIRIQISPEDPISKNVAHAVMDVEMDDKRFFLARLIEQNPEGKFVVFVRSRVRAERVAKAMERVQISTVTLHGEKLQEDRLQILKGFREGQHRILIATDLAARGIDVPDVTHVVNYDLPENPKNYVHRVGRTGRGFNKGLAISFCAKEEKPLLAEIQELIGKPIEKVEMSQTEYKFIQTLAKSRAEVSLEQLIAQEEAWETNKKKKRRK